VTFLDLMNRRYGGTGGPEKLDMAAEFRVNVSTVKRWANGSIAVPYAVVLALKLLGAAKRERE